MALRFITRGTMALFIVLVVVVMPYLTYRWHFLQTKRLIEVAPGRVYRCGQMTSAGFSEAVERHGIRTIINLMNEFPDPDLATDPLRLDSVKEVELCKQLGVNYVWIAPDLLPRRQVPPDRPKTIDEFLEIMDNPASYPVLIHCRAGLHRTGCLVAVYRMEYEGWTPHQAIEEMKAIGFGEWNCTSANDYVAQYVLSYQPGKRAKASRIGRGASSPQPGGGDE